MAKAPANVRFIGRQSELAAIDAALTAAQSGSMWVVLLSGDAGVGKSRLTGEAIDHARRSGFSVLLGGCVNLRDDAAPLAPLAEALRGLAADMGIEQLRQQAGRDAAALDTLLPGISTQTERASSQVVMYPAEPDQLHSSMVDLFVGLAETRPLALVIEDIHWADRKTLDFLRLLTRNLRQSRACLFLTYRADEQDRELRLQTFLAELHRATHVERIAVRPFSRGEFAEQAHAILGRPLKRSEVEALHARSEGNAFYAEQLLAAGSPQDELPDTLHDLLDARLGVLTSDSRAVVGALAVAAKPATESDIQQVTEIAPKDFQRTVRDLLDRKLIERRRVSGDDRISMRHALLQEAAYADLFSAERQELHASFAALLETRTEAARPDVFDLAELSRHWESAGMLDAAFRSALRAARAAEVAYAPDLAAEQYERAVRLQRQIKPSSRDDDFVNLLQSAARAASEAGSDGAIALIEEALDLVDPLQDPVTAGLLYERLGRYKWYAADGAGALLAYDRAVELVPVEPPSSARARVTAGIGQVLMIHGRVDESVPWCEEALRNARAVGDQAVTAHAQNTLGIDTAYMGDPETGLAMLASSKALAEEIGSWEDVARGVSNTADVLFTSGRFAEAADLGRDNFRYLEEHGQVISAVSALSYSTWALASLGRWQEALETIDLVQRQPTDANDHVISLAIAAMIETCRGDAELAESHLAMLRDAMTGVIDTQLLIPYAIAEAEAGLWRGRPHVAVAAIRYAIEHGQRSIGAMVSRYGPIYWLGLRAAADVVLSADATDEERKAARQFGADCSAAMDEIVASIARDTPAYSVMTETFASLCRAERTRLGDSNDPDAWALAVQLQRYAGRPYQVAYAARHEAAALLGRGGRLPEARQALTEAHAIATELGARPLAAQIEALARRAGIDLTGEQAETSGGRDPFSLTTREREVLRLVAAGKTNRQIGEELFITEKTASVHVSNILSKLGASRRTEAAALAAELGLGGPAPVDPAIRG